MDSSSVTIAVVGGSGFIGTALTRILINAGFKVRILDIAAPPACSTDAEYRYSDVTKLPLLTETLAGCTWIVNLAAAHRDDVRPPSLYHEVNVFGAENVCLAAEVVGINNILFTSSVAVYGLPVGVPNEETRLNPFNLYGKTKSEAEVVFRNWQQRGPGRKLEIVRPTVVFGPGNRGNVYNLFAQLRHSKFVMIGRGKNRKSIAYVQNVASYLAYLIQVGHEPGAYLYNYCDTPAYSMTELLREIRTALNKPAKPFAVLPYAAGMAIASLFDVAAFVLQRNFPISVVRIRKFCADTVFSSERVENSGFKPPYELSQSIRHTITYEFGSGAQ